HDRLDGITKIVGQGTKFRSDVRGEFRRGFHFDLGHFYSPARPTPFLAGGPFRKPPEVKRNSRPLPISMLMLGIQMGAERCFRCCSNREFVKGSEDMRMLSR